MADPLSSYDWLGRFAFLAATFVVMAVDIIPGDMRPPRFAAPDVLFVLTVAWVIYRPQHVPLLSVAVVFLLADMLYLRPPGLWTLIVVWLTEGVRRRHSDFQTMSFLMEWAAVASLITAAAGLYLIALLVFVLPTPPLVMGAMHAAGTIVIYPLVAFVLQGLFGVFGRASQDRTGKRMTL